MTVPGIGTKPARAISLAPQEYSSRFWCCCALLTLTAAVEITTGTYSVAGLVLIAVSGACCVVAIHRYTKPEERSDARASRAITLTRRVLWLVVLLHVSVGVYVIRAIPVPVIDVYNIQRDSAAALLDGVNPYTITHQDVYDGESTWYAPGVATNGHINIGFPYPPLSLLFVLPGYVFGDIRYSYLLALVMSALLIAEIKPSVFANTVAVLLLLNPIPFVVLHQSWTEPAVLLTFCCVMYAAVRRPKYLPLALGMFLGSKQYTVLALPLTVLLLQRFSWREYALLVFRGIGIAAAFTAPLAMWAPKHFWRDVVVLQIVQPFRPDALSFSALLANHGMRPIPVAVVIIAVLICILWTLKAPRNPSMFACSFALVLLVFFSLNKQAFCNYYFLVIGTLCIAACVLPVGKTDYDRTLQLAIDHRLIGGNRASGQL